MCIYRHFIIQIFDILFFLYFLFVEVLLKFLYFTLKFDEHPYNLFFEFFIKKISYFCFLRVFCGGNFSSFFIWEIVFCFFILFGFLWSFIWIRENSSLLVLEKWPYIESILGRICTQGGFGRQAGGKWLLTAFGPLDYCAGAVTLQVSQSTWIEPSSTLWKWRGV